MTNDPRQLQPPCGSIVEALGRLDHSDNRDRTDLTRSAFPHPLKGILMASTTSTSPVVTKTAVGGTGAGFAGAIALIVHAFLSGHGFSMADAVGILGSLGLSSASVLGLVSHHTGIAVAMLQHDAAIAVADVPDISKLRADLDAAQAKLSQFDPSLGARVDGIAASFRQEVATLSADAEKRAGVTPEQVKSLIDEAFSNVRNAFAVPVQGTSLAQTVTPAAAQVAAAAQVPTSVVAPQPAAPTS